MGFCYAEEKYHLIQPKWMFSSSAAKVLALSQILLQFYTLELTIRYFFM